MDEIQGRNPQEKKYLSQLFDFMDKYGPLIERMGGWDRLAEPDAEERVYRAMAEEGLPGYREAPTDGETGVVFRHQHMPRPRNVWPSPWVWADEIAGGEPSLGEFRRGQKNYELMANLDQNLPDTSGYYVDRIVDKARLDKLMDAYQKGRFLED